MHDLDEEIRRGLERLTAPDNPNDVIAPKHLASRPGSQRPRHPARLLAPIAVVTAIVVGILAVTVRYRDQSDVTAEQGAAVVAPAPQLIVDSIEVAGSFTTRGVEITFDGPLPDTEITFVESLEAVGVVNEIVYTIQPASKVNVCENVHSFPPPADGTVDVLVPASWFASSDEPNIGPLQRVGQPAKFVPCGPYNGYYQYSIWGPASIDPSEVSVTVENGGRSLVVSILP